MVDLPSPAFPDCAASASAPPRLPFPYRTVPRLHALDQPRAIGQWLEQKISNGDLDRLNQAELRDLRTAGLMLEGWGLPRETPRPKPAGWLARMLRRIG